MISNAVNLPTSSSRKHFPDQIVASLVFNMLHVFGEYCLLLPKTPLTLSVRVFFNLSDLASILVLCLVGTWCTLLSLYLTPLKAALIFILKWFRRKNLRRIITASNMQTKCHILVNTSSIMENNIILYCFREGRFSLKDSKNIYNLRDKCQKMIINFKKITQSHVHFIEK